MLKVRTGEYREAASKLMVAEKKVVLGVRRELRAAGKPVGTALAQAIGGAMPVRGGLADRVSAAKIGLAVNLKLGVGINLRTPGMKTSQFESGEVRHPTFGHKPWVAQSVPAGKGAEELVNHADDLRERIINIIESAVA